MKLEKVCEFLESQPRFYNGGSNYYIACPFCAENTTKQKAGNLSIKVDVEPGEPMFYNCFRAECGKSGILRTEDLQLMGCVDPDTIFELAAWNKEVNPRLEKKFIVKKDQGYQFANLNISDNKAKLDYINTRLGTSLTFMDLRNYKIQLGLYEFLRINYIDRLAFSPKFCNLLDEYTISFLSMYSDYLICRDITKKIVTGNRYTMYRIRGKPTEGDMKIYAIPTELDILTPKPVDINIAEGTFSILGAYLNTDTHRPKKRNIWLANCGSGYKNTLFHITRQYGLLNINLNIWSDSEIKLEKYEKLLKEAKYHMHINNATVYYNETAEDFGYPKNKIRISKVELD